MSEKFWIEIATFILAAIALAGVFYTKKEGWGRQTTQALIIAIGIPAVVVLGLEGILNSQAISAILAAFVGFGVGKAAQ